MATLTPELREMNDINDCVPQTVYSTPDGWGSETFYGTYAEMETMALELRQLGDGWESVDADDCDDWDLYGVDNGVATYRRAFRGIRKGYNYVCLSVEPGGGVGERAIEVYFEYDE